ncbi:MAG TPA: DUF1904 domain-containing protein [Clostridiales bacterium UBA8960]|jgi:phenylpyruvate tautomerase PptA (4-oxalocrotonate tautomerase family)|nr:DUF1904 domain-containing protein [Clostridiales bacterium UBA8960]
MPHIIYKGLELNQVKTIEARVVDALSQIIDCPVDHFTTEWTPTTFISRGVENQGGYPFVTINWFKRSETMQSEVAEVITDLIKAFGYEDVCVYFNEMSPSHYYENGTHF